MATPTLKKKVNRKVQEEPQAEFAANNRFFYPHLTPMKDSYNSFPVLYGLSQIPTNKLRKFSHQIMNKIYLDSLSYYTFESLAYFRRRYFHHEQGLDCHIPVEMSVNLHHMNENIL